MGRILSGLVVVGSFLNLLLSNGFRQCIGLFFVRWQEEFNRTAEDTGWIGSNILVGYAAAGLSLAMFGSRLSCRVITFSGGALACTALACCVFANEVWHVFLLMFLSGFGLGMVRSASLTIIGFYVKKRLGLAYGFATAGASFGTLILSPTITLLIEVYSWRGAMLVTAGILANQCAVASLYRQSDSEATATAKNIVSNAGCDDRGELTVNNDQACFEYLFVDTKRKPSVGKRIRKTSSQVAIKIRKTSVKVANNVTRSDIVAILTNIRLIFLSIAHFCRGFGYFASIIHFIALCLDNDVSLSKSAMLLSVLGIGGIVSCLSHGILLDKNIIKPLHFSCISLCTSCLSCIIIAIHVNFTTLIVFVIIFGASTSISNALATNCIRQVLGDDLHLLKGNIGLAMTLSATGGLVGIPVLGRLFDMTQNYANSYYLAGGVFFVGGICMALTILFMHIDERSRKTSDAGDKPSIDAT